MKKLLLALFLIGLGCGGTPEDIVETESAFVTSDACGMVVTTNTINYNCVKHPHWICDTYDFGKQKCVKTKPKDPLPGTLPCGARPFQNYDTIVWHGWNGLKSNAPCMIVPQFSFFTQAGQNPDMLMDYGWSYSGKASNVVGSMLNDSMLVFVQVNGTSIAVFSGTQFTGDQKVWSSPLPTIWITDPSWNSFTNPPGEFPKVIQSFYTF